MMFIMDSKVFRNEFLTRERDKDILDTQYVIISTRIRKRDSKFMNICVYNSKLYPASSVLMCKTEEDMNDEYNEQLENELVVLATLVMGCIEEGYNIVFMCTEQESKLNYLRYLSEFIYSRLGYPVYDYSLFINGRSRIMKWDENSVKKKCKKIIKQAKSKRFEENLRTEKGRKQNVKSFSQLSKKEMKKHLKSRSLYYDGMSKAEMIDTFEVYM